MKYCVLTVVDTESVVYYIGLKVQVKWFLASNIKYEENGRTKLDLPTTTGGPCLTKPQDNNLLFLD